MYYAAKDRAFGDFLPHASSMSKGHGRVTLGTVCSLRWGPPRPRGRLFQSPPRRDKQPLFQDRPRLWPPEGGLGAGTDSWSEERVSGGLQKSEEVLLSPGVQMTFQGCTWGTTVFSASEQRYGSHRVLPGVDLGVAGEKENKIELWFSAVTNLGRARRAVSLMPPGNWSQVWTSGSQNRPWRCMRHAVWAKGFCTVKSLLGFCNHSAVYFSDKVLDNSWLECT